MTERDGIIYIGQHKFMFLKSIMGWCKTFNLQCNLAVLANSSVKELREYKHLARHRKELNFEK